MGFVIAAVVPGGTRSRAGAVPIAPVDATSAICLGRIAATTSASASTSSAAIRRKHPWKAELEVGVHVGVQRVGLGTSVAGVVGDGLIVPVAIAAMLWTVGLWRFV